MASTQYFQVTHNLQKLTIPIDVSAHWLELRLSLPQGSVIGVLLPNGLEVDITTHGAQRTQLINTDCLLVLAKPGSSIDTGIPVPNEIRDEVTQLRNTLHKLEIKMQETFLSLDWSPVEGRHHLGTYLFPGTMVAYDLPGFVPTNAKAVLVQVNWNTGS